MAQPLVHMDQAGPEDRRLQGLMRLAGCGKALVFVSLREQALRTPSRARPGPAKPERDTDSWGVGGCDHRGLPPALHKVTAASCATAEEAAARVLVLVS